MRDVRLCLVLGAVLLTLASSAAGASPPIRVTMSTSSTKPFADTPWRYSVAARRAGNPVAARMRLQVLRGTTVVGCWRGTVLRSCSSARTWISFTGVRKGVITWSPRSVGSRLTFQALVVVGDSALRLRAPVTVRRS
jgi:hypothetical protein